MRGASSSSSHRQGVGTALWISMATAVFMPVFGMASLNGRTLRGVGHVISGWLPAFGQLALVILGSILLALVVALLCSVIVRRSRSA